MGDYVVGELCREFLDGGFFTTCNLFVLVREFVHCGCPGAACGLVGGYMHAPDGGEVVDGLKRHDHLDGGAVGVADYAAWGVECVVAIDFGHYKWHIIVHAESAGVVNHQGAVLGDGFGKFARGGCTCRGESDVDVAEVVVVPEFLYNIFLPPERVGASGASRGAEKGEVVNGKVCLVEHAQQFLTYGAAGANDCYVHCLWLKSD